MLQIEHQTVKSAISQINNIQRVYTYIFMF